MGHFDSAQVERKNAVMVNKPIAKEGIRRVLNQNLLSLQRTDIAS